MFVIDLLYAIVSFVVYFVFTYYYTFAVAPTRKALPSML